MVDIIHMSLVVVFSAALLWADHKHIPIGSHKYESKYVPPIVNEAKAVSEVEKISKEFGKSEPLSGYITSSMYHRLMLDIEVKKTKESLNEARKQYSSYVIPKMPQMPKMPDYPPKMNEYLRNAIEERKISNNDQRIKDLNDRMNALMDYYIELIKNNVSDKFAEHIKRQIDEIAEERDGLRKVQTNDQKA